MTTNSTYAVPYGVIGAGSLEQDAAAECRSLRQMLADMTRQRDDAIADRERVEKSLDELIGSVKSLHGRMVETHRLSLERRGVT